MNFSEEHMISINSSIAGKNFAKFLDVEYLVDANSNADLSGLLWGVQNIDEKINLSMRLWNWHRNTQERIERVGLALAPGTRQTRPKLRLENRVHKRVVASHVVLQSLRRHVVGFAKRILQQLNFSSSCWENTNRFILVPEIEGCLAIEN